MKSPFKKKRLFTVALAAVISIAFIIGLSLSMPFVAFNINTMHTVSAFGFVDGYARVNTDYIGYENELDIRVNIKIERKQSFLSFQEIVNEDVTSQGVTYQNEFFYPIDKDGIYRCTVTYTVMGQNGEDVITFRDIQTYRASDYPEHTHVWTDETVIETPSCNKVGKAEKLCRCGEKQITEIAKTPHVPGDPVVALQPTGGKDGLLCQYCEICKQVLMEERIPATGAVGLAYRVNEDGKTCTVIGMGTCEDKIVVINEYIDGYCVTAIGEKAFKDQSLLTGIKLPDSVITVANEAFMNCQNLASVKLSANLTKIGERAFYGCSAVMKLELPDTLNALGTSAFGHMSGIYSVELPNGITEIPEGLFYGCRMLNDLKIRGELRTIGKEAFAYTALRSFVFPDMLTDVPQGIFIGCEALTSVTLPNAATRIGEYAFQHCTALTSVTVPDTVEVIESYAFHGCTALTEIRLSQGLTAIGNDAFWRCTALLSVEFPKTLTFIGSDAFYACESLTAVHLPEKAIHLGEGIFTHCSGLSEVTLPSGLTAIPDAMFA